MLLLPAAAMAQDQGTRASFQMTPAASPALIEQQRIAITDGEGRYAFAQLSPGTYDVTCSLPGFNQILREGVELTSGFTANITVELGVGGIESGRRHSERAPADVGHG